MRTNNSTPALGRNVAAIHTRRAALRLNSFDPETGRFTAIAATETPVARSDFFDGEYVEVLSLNPNAVRLGRLQSGRAPILDSHRAGSSRDVIGSALNGRIEQGQLIVDGQLSQRDDVRPIAADMAAGVLRNVSIGYRVHASTEAKGRDGARVITRTDWEPIELSIVPIAADPQAHIRSAKGHAMPPENDVVEIETDPCDHPADDVASQSTNRAGAAPVLRMTQLQVRQIREQAVRNGISEDFVNRCVADGMTIEQYRTAAFDELANRSNTMRLNPAHSSGLRGGDGATTLNQALAGALYARMTGGAAEGPAAEWRGRSLLEMGAAVVEARGERPHWRSRERLAAQILTRAGAPHTTSDFPILLSQAGNRVLMDAYKVAETPLKLIAARRDATDFRSLSAVKLSEAPRLLEVAESGEVKHGSRAEAKESFRLKTFARIFGLTRQALINDDLQTFADTNRAWGRAAAETEADQLVALFTSNSGNGVTLDDGSALYTTSRGNKSGSGTVIDIANLGLARKALRDMKGLDGVTPISVTPKHLVVGSAKETEAEQVLTAIAAAQVSNVNPFGGKLTLHVEPRLTGNAWRLFADPAELPVIAIAYLSGQQGPILETQQGWEVLGTEFRCVLDFGAGITSWRGTYLNPGN